MKKMIKSLSVLVFLFVLSFVLVSTVSADAPVITAADGASLRTTGDNQGIKFTATLDTLEGVTEHGFLVAKGAYTLDEMKAGANEKQQKVALNGTNKTFNLVIFGLDSAEDYLADLTVVAYAVYEGGTSYGAAVTRNMAEVAFEAKNAGDTSTLVGNVITDVNTNNYKKVWNDSFGNVVIDNAIYETNPIELGNMFIADYNNKMGTSVAITGFAAQFKSSKYLDSSWNYVGTLDQVISNNLYVFYQNEDMMAKWGWVLDYVATIDNSGFVPDQVAMIKDANENVLGSWYDAQHISGRIQGLFTCAKTSGLFFNSSEFAKEASYANLQTTLDNLTNKLYTHGDYKYVALNETINLPTAPAKEGYSFAWSDGNSTYLENTEYQISDNAKLVPVYTPIQYTIKFYDGDKELTELQITYDVEDTVSLPSYEKEGASFDGWFTEPEFTNKVESYSAGTTGDIVLFAKTTEGAFEVNLSLDGGNLLYASYDAIIADYDADYKTYSGQGSYSVWKAGSYQLNMFTQTNHKWDWLLDYWSLVNTNSYNGTTNASVFQKVKTEGTCSDYYFLAVETTAFYNSAQKSVYSGSLKSADYADQAVRDQIWTVLNSLAEETIVASGTYVLPTVAYKVGYTFGGWYTNAECTGEAVTEVSAATTVYAKWIAA